MIQEIIVGIIGIIVLGIIIYKGYVFFFKKKNPANNCGCSGCFYYEEKNKKNITS